MVQFLTHDGDAVGANNFENTSAPTRDFWNRVLGVPWKRTYASGHPHHGLGNWLDSAQVAEGAAVYATSAPVAGVGPVQLTVTALVRRWLTTGANRGFYLRSRLNAWPLSFAGRTAADSASRPTLTVVTSTGTFTLVARANASWAPSTFQSLSSSAQFRLAENQQVGLLHFDLGAVTGDLTRAMLTISVSAREQNGAVIDVLEADPPLLSTLESVTAPVLGLRAGFASFAAMRSSGDARVLWCNDYAASGPMNNAAFLAAPQRILDPATGTTFARAGFVAGQNDSHNFRASVVKGVLEASGASEPGKRGYVPDKVRNELYTQFRLRLRPGFGSAISAIKFPCIDAQMGYWNTAGYWQSTAGNGGAPSDGTKKWAPSISNWVFEGHSSRLLIGQLPMDSTAYADLFGIADYLYNLDQVGPFPAGVGIPVVLKKNVWYTFDIFQKMNSITGPFDALGNGTAVADGEFKIWINGALVHTRLGMRWRRHPSLGVSGQWQDVYHGGVAPAPQTIVDAYDVDQVTVATAYIGPPS